MTEQVPGGEPPAKTAADQHDPSAGDLGRRDAEPSPSGVPGNTVAWTPPTVPVVALVPGAPGLRFADTASRFVAYLIDGVILVIPTIVAYVVLGRLSGTETGVLYLTNVILSLAYFVFFWTGGRRATPGQRMFELQVGNAVDGSGLTLSQAVKRWLLLGNVLFLLDVVPMLSRVTSPLWFGWAIVLLVTVARSPTKQGFHDRLANTAVVRPLSARSSGLAKALVAAFGILIVGSLVAIVALVFLGSQVSTLLSARPATEPAASATGVADGSDRQVEVSLLQAGDCFDVVAGPAEGAYLAAPRSCDQPHALEQISLITIPAGSGDPYPGDGAISGLVEPKCAADFAAYVGRSGPDSIYNYAYLVMPKSSWDAGERRVPCGAGSDDPAEQITGSVRNAGR